MVEMNCMVGIKVHLSLGPFSSIFIRNDAVSHGRYSLFDVLRPLLPLPSSSLFFSPKRQRRKRKKKKGKEKEKSEIFGARNSRA